MSKLVMLHARKKFRQEIWRNFRAHGRDFAWRQTRDPYKILVSEIMLQQTQTRRVAQKYPAFIRTFPNFKSLAVSPFPKVLRAWQGMGYNRRALALKKIAVLVTKKHHGRLPQDILHLVELPGIGHATAGAVMAFAFNKPVPFIETNIRRVYIHFFFPRRKNVRDEEIMELVKATLDTKHPREWYYALMDYGAGVLKTVKNPNRRAARYRVQAPFTGSVRQARGKVIRLLVDEPRLTAQQIAVRIKQPLVYTRKILIALAQEGFLLQQGAGFLLETA